MDSRVGFMLLVLAVCYIDADAESLASFNAKAFAAYEEIARNESKTLKVSTKNDPLCIVCEEFAAQALSYLGDKETQAEIIKTLHQACTVVHPLKKKCIKLVNVYVPYFFHEIATVQPEQFCKAVDLCELSDGACTLCHGVVSEILTKLSDPDTQLEIIEILLKACKKVQSLVPECKKLVFEYGPLILANAEKFLETTDICADIAACKSKHKVSVELLSAA